MRWKHFGSKPKPTKSLKETYEELQKLEKKEKEAEEKALMQKRIAEIKHKKRIAIMGKLKSIGATTEHFVEKEAKIGFKKARPFIKKEFAGHHKKSRKRESDSFTL